MSEEQELGMNDEQRPIMGKEIDLGKTKVWVAPHPEEVGGFAVVLATGELVTRFGISRKTLAAMLALMMQQGVIDVAGMRITTQSHLDEKSQHA